MKFSQFLRYAGILCLLAILAAGPFFQGLFFWTPLLFAIALLSAGFGLWLIGRRLSGQPTALFGGATGIALLALLGCYLLQFAWAVYPRGNLDWTLRVAAGWMAYVMIRAEAGPTLRRWLAWVLVVSAAGVGLIGFLEFTGYFAKDPAMVQALKLVGLNTRMFTSFQYPNTAAAYFLAALFAAIGLAAEELRSAWRLGLLGGLSTFLWLSFFFTVSRGAVVVLPFGLLLLFLGLDREKRWPVLLLLLAAIAPMLVAMNGVGANAAIQNYISAFRWLGAAALGGAVAGVALSLFLRLKPKAQYGLAAAGLLLIIGAFAVVRPGSLLPTQATRLLDINFKTVNVVLRLIYDQDALRIVADHPLGRGAWGWDRTYRQVQEFNYIARETHDHYAQTAVEAGIPGLLALLAALGLALVSTWKVRRSHSLAWALAAGAFLVAGHSLIDFDLSYGLIWLLLWAMLAAADVPASLRRWEAPAWWGGVASAVGVALFAAVLGAGSAYYDRAQQFQEQEQPEQAVAMAQRSIRFDPWNSQPYLLIGDKASLEQAVRRDPNHSGARFDLAIKLELERDLSGALREAKAALGNQPQVTAYYTKVASLTGTLMVDAVGKGNRAEAVRLAEELERLQADFARRKAVADPLQHLWNARKLELEPVLQLRYGQALYLLGDEAGAEPHLQAAAKVGLLGSEAEVWLYALYERRGDKSALAALEQKPWIRFRHANPVYKAIRGW